MQAWQRTWWAVFVANLIAAVGMMSFLPFFPSYLEELGLEDRGRIAAWTGVLFGAAPLAAAVMGPIWGSVGDRFGRKLMVLRALLAISLFVGMMGLVTSPWQLLFLRLGQGIFSGFIPPSITLVSVSVPASEQGRVTGSLQAALPAGMIAGPLCGALIQGTLGIRWVFLFVSVAAAMAALFVALFAREEAELRATLEPFSPTSILGGVFSDLRELLGTRAVRSAILVLFVVQFGMAATNPLLELYVREVWDGDARRVAPLTAGLFTSLAIAGVVATPIWGRLGDRITHGRALRRAALASALFLALHAAVPVYAWLFGARVLLGLSSPGINVSAFGIAATETATDRRGNAFGAVFSARALAISLGAMSGGWLASALGIRGLFLLGGASVALLLAFVRPESRPRKQAAR